MPSQSDISLQRRLVGGLCAGLPVLGLLVLAVLWRLWPAAPAGVVPLGWWAAAAVLAAAFGALSALAWRLRATQSATESAPDSRFDGFPIPQVPSETEQRTRAVADHLPAFMAYLDRDLRYVFANRHYQTVLGLDPEHLIGKTVREVRGEAVFQAIAPHAEAALQGRAATFEVEETRGDVLFNTQYHYIPARARDGSVRGVYAMGFDITALRQAQLEQQRSERRLRDIADNLPVLISYIDRDERMGFCNGTHEQWFGVARERIEGRTLLEFWGAELYEQRRPFVLRALAGQRLEFEARRETPGKTRWLLNAYIPDVGADGVVAGVYMLSSDVTALKDVQHQLSEQARHDTLTGLANRYHFNERLAEALSRARRKQEPLALMYLDIDRFKAINDSHGHAVGDAVLKEFAQRLKQCVRMIDTVARLAGDEFVVILENVHSEAEPQFVARKIVARINHPFEVDGLKLSVTTSIGIAFQPPGPTNADELLARADKALYAAKAVGRNNYQLAASS